MVDRKEEIRLNLLNDLEMKDKGQSFETVTELWVMRWRDDEVFRKRIMEEEYGHMRDAGFAIETNIIERKIKRVKRIERIRR